MVRLLRAQIPYLSTVSLSLSKSLPISTLRVRNPRSLPTESQRLTVAPIHHSMTKSSTCKSLKVFDFKEEDELQESSSTKLMEKINNLSAENQAMLKYNFLQFVASGANGETNELGSPTCVDVDAIDSDHSCDNVISCSPLGTVGDDYASKEGESGLDVVPLSVSTSNGQHLHFEVVHPDYGSLIPELEMKTSIPRESSPGNIELNCALPESPSNDEPVDMISDANESMKDSSPSISAFNFADNDISLDGCSPDHCFGGWEMDDKIMDVNLYPDFLMCQNTYCTDALISFSSSCIRIGGSLTNGNHGTFNYQLGIDDILDVECQWYGRDETAMVKLHVISKNSVGVSDALPLSGTQELIFAVVDSNWPVQQENITSLNVRYKAMWNVVIDNLEALGDLWERNDMEMDEGSLLGQNSIFSSKHFFPNFDQPFEEVIYPKGDSDPVSISKRDVDLLQPESFINDTIIDFYIKYLKNKIQPEEKLRFHFFNSFFFRKLADLDKDPFIASEGRAAFLRVRKWTRKVNLFEKDYVFIPVNFNFHWSLIVICHPGEVANFKDEDVEKAPKVPCILHMDSIKGTHAGLKNHIQSYLWEEWKEKQNEVSENISSKFHNMRFIPLELPQQENSFDCGLFLLHYVELFLEEAPDNFSPFKITKFSSFLNVDWFPPAEASLKRAPILRLIHKILENHSHEASPDDCDEEHQSSKFSEHNNKNRTGVEFFSDSYNPSKPCHGNLLGCQTSQGIEMTLLAASSIRSSQYLNDSGLVVKEFFDPGATAVLDGQFQAFDQTPSFYQYKGPVAPVEEDTETGEHFVYSQSGETGSLEMDGFVPYSSEDFAARRSWLVESSMKVEQEYDNSSPETSLCVSDDDSSDVGIIENSSLKEREELSQIENSDQQRSSLMENIDCSTESRASASSEMLETTVSEDLDNPEKLHDINVNEDRPLSSCHEFPLQLLHQDSDNECDDDNGKIQCGDDMQNIGDDDLVTESDEQQAAKRLRLTLPHEED